MSDELDEKQALETKMELARAERLSRAEVLKQSKKEDRAKILKISVMVGLLIVVVAGIIVGTNIYNKSKNKKQPDMVEELEQGDEFDLSTDAGKVAYTDRTIGEIMASDVYVKGNWLSRKHYVYTELLKLEEDGIIGAIYYDTATLSFSIQHMNGSVRWYAISKERDSD